MIVSVSSLQCDLEVNHNLNKITTQYRRYEKHKIDASAKKGND